MPFLAIGTALIILGVLLEDDFQIKFGLVWLAIAGLAAVWRSWRGTT